MLALGLSCCACLAVAQDTTQVGNTKLGDGHFCSINQVGVATGESYHSLLIQSVNGLRYKTWFMGLGAGIDTYSEISIPLFIDVRKNLLAKPNTPFLYADAGMQIMAEKSNRDKTNFNWRIYHPGLYYDFGAGYYLPLKNKDALLLSAGYSVKKIEVEQGAGRFAYRFDRYSFKLGYKL